LLLFLVSSEERRISVCSSCTRFFPSSWQFVINLCGYFVRGTKESPLLQALLIDPPTKWQTPKGILIRFFCVCLFRVTKHPLPFFVRCLDSSCRNDKYLRYFVDVFSFSLSFPGTKDRCSGSALLLGFFPL
jgi:hypothetical protein